MTDQKFNCVWIQEKCIELDPHLYKAIQIIQAPFLPVKINHQFLTQGQNLLLAGVNYDWHIIACWIIYLQTEQRNPKKSPHLNPKKSPYNLQDFQDRKTWGQVLNAQLNLCAGVQQFKSVNKIYPSHYESWINCMQEIRKWRVNSILECPTISGEQPILKTQQIRGIRKFIKELRENNKILLPNREDTQHNYNLLDTAIKLASSENSPAKRECFRQKYWEPFLDAYSIYATDIYNNSELKSVFPWKDGLAHQDIGRFAPRTILFKAKLEQKMNQQLFKSGICKLKNVLLDNENKEGIQRGQVMIIVNQAGQICEFYDNKRYGIDGEIEFKDDNGKPSGKRIYIQLKSGDSYLSLRQDGKLSVYIKKREHLEYWKQQPYPVYLIVRDGKGKMYWRNVTEYLTKHPNNQTRTIVFSNEDEMTLKAIQIVRLIRLS
ncbi:MAG: DUF4365 domain-containing protein [Nostoc sp. NOS(2021)]|uniref:DUF4365 domain-containing protein n=1 Tax=Nostoc sp. NOS(2021) TaxID=2815407 RepID=UPI0025E93B6A|nr:DUF4365 domain-containing protein [Nostoc sp. NOS(2021)]MBN3899948.1 DUF4365 domain-containing protein [Nostoc sp. NOS(2021)]